MSDSEEGAFPVGVRGGDSSWSAVFLVSTIKAIGRTCEKGSFS